MTEQLSDEIGTSAVKSATRLTEPNILRRALTNITRPYRVLQGVLLERQTAEQTQRTDASYAGNRLSKTSIEGRLSDQFPKWSVGNCHSISHFWAAIQN
jgi:hypothetical protein